MTRRLTLFFGITALLCLSSPRSCSSVYDKFDKCAPVTCGGVEIRYPFYMEDLLQPSYCGEPGYNLSCPILHGARTPRIRAASTTLYITAIDYSFGVFYVYDDAFQRVEDTCSVPDRNMSLVLSDEPWLTLDTRSTGIRHTSVVLYTECRKPLQTNLTLYSSSQCPDPILVMLLGDPQSVHAARECRRSVRRPVVVYDGELALSGEELSTKGAGANWKEYRTVLSRGFVFNWTAPSCDNCANSGGRCAYHDGVDSLCLCSDRAYPSTCPPRHHLRNMVVSIGASVAGLAVIVGVVTLLLIKKKRRKNSKIIIDFLKNNEMLTPKKYKYSEIKKMTRSFKDKLGQGGFGSVYKGELKDGRLVAVKVLSSTKSSNGEDFMNEAASISRTSHVNIVSLIGFCISGSKRALIYQYMANGSLEKFIYEEKLSKPQRLLEWDKLHSIAVGIAQGLEYLRRGCNTRILHFDIKPHNILLDEDFCPKISDFGLAKVCIRKESAVSMFGARGTVGYIAPEQVCRNFGPVSHKSDVYSYGMMILEMVGGRKNVEAQAENASEIYFPHWIYKRLESDQELGLNGIIGEEARVRARKMVITGLWCIQADPANRPPMSQVVDMLQGSVELLSVPPKPYMYSPSSSSQHSLATLASSNSSDTTPILNA